MQDWNGIKQMSSEDLFDCMTEKQRDDIYRMVWHDYVYDDVIGFLEDDYADYELPDTDEKVDELVGDIANLIVYHGKYENNIGYWDNIKNLLDERR